MTFYAATAGARYGQARVLEAYAQMPTIDFSPIGRLGDNYYEGYTRGRQIAIQEEMIKAAMVACMARSGYLQQS